MYILEGKKLSKSYGQNKAVNSLDIGIENGEILALLGPNGAGKSTLISLLLGIVKADTGEIFYQDTKINFHNNREFKRKVGFVPQDLAFFPELSAVDNVKYWGKIYGLKGNNLKKAIDNALEITGLSEHAKEKPAKFSGGMKRRLNIACGIVHSPEILILDEPTVGVDPQSRNHILQEIKKLKEGGTSIIYTTHYIEEVENISDNVVIMDHGKVIAKGTVETLIEAISDNRVVHLNVDDVNTATNLLKQITSVVHVAEEENGILIKMTSNDALTEIVDTLADNEINIISINMEKPSLEDVFFYYTGSKFRDE